MALQAIANINVDFYDKKYISINAKQLDRKTRFLSVTCYSHGELYNLNDVEHSAYIRYKKSDGYSVFNFCDINPKGKILVELTEQMLSIEGICYADLVIVNKGSAVVDKKTGEIVAIDNTGILSTMPIYIDVFETAFENSVVESSYEYDGLNDLMERAEADYTEVILASKSWAIGDTGTRSGEDADNAKYYSKQSSNSASASNTSALNATNSEKLAEAHMHNALTYSQNAQTYMGNAQTYMNNAEASENRALVSETNAKTSETNAKTSEVNAKTSETNALSSEQNAKTSEANAKTSEQKAETSETNALLSEQNAKTSETNAKTSEVNAKNAQDASEIARQNAERAAEQAAENAVDNVLVLMNDHVTLSQEAATNAANSEQAAATSEANAKVSETNASTSEVNAKISEQAAANSATGAYASEVNAFTSEANASFSEANALGYSDIAKSYAVGDTGTRDNEDVDNAKYYYELISNIVNNLNSNIATIDEVKGYLSI